MHSSGQRRKGKFDILIKFLTFPTMKQGSLPHHLVGEGKSSILPLPSLLPLSSFFPLPSSRTLPMAMARRSLTGRALGSQTYLYIKVRSGDV